MSTYKIQYDAVGHMNGCVWTSTELLHGRIAELIIDSDRWSSLTSLGSVQAQERTLLADARIKWPEVNWEHATYRSIQQI